MRLDVHAHEFPERYLREINRLIARGKFPRVAEPLLPWRLDQQLDHMDGTGVDVMVLALTSATYVADRSLARELARIANEAFVEAAKKYPDKFRVFCFVPLGHVGDAITELEHCVEDLGCHGLILGTNVRGRPLNHPGFLPFFEVVNRMRLPVLLHPMDAGWPKPYKEFRLDLWIGWPFETTLAVARMVLSGLCDRFPDFPLILSHLGGNILQVVERIHMASGRGRAEKPPLAYFKRFYYDTAGPVTPEAVRCAAEMFGVDRIVFGTDYPFGPGRGRVFGEKAVACVEGLPVGPQEKAKVYGGTAWGLLEQRVRRAIANSPVTTKRRNDGARPSG